MATFISELAEIPVTHDYEPITHYDLVVAVPLLLAIATAAVAWATHSVKINVLEKTLVSLTIDLEKDREKDITDLKNWIKSENKMLIQEIVHKFNFQEKQLERFHERIDSEKEQVNYLRKLIEINAKEIQSLHERLNNYFQEKQ